MTPTKFEDRLLGELRQIVAARPAPQAEPATARRRRPPRLVLGGAVTAAIAAAAVVIGAGGDPAAPAYAVDRQSDGDVTVTINELSDADGLERELRAAGIAAVVDYTPVGKACREPRGRTPARSGSAGRASSSISMSEGSVSFTISRNTVGSGQTLVITTSGGAGLSSVGMSVVEGAVAPCELVDAPAPPREAINSRGGGELDTSTGGGAGPSLHTGP